MSVITVLGEVDESKIGIVAPHEHLILDISKKGVAQAGKAGNSAIFDEKVSIKILGQLMVNGLACRDNLILSDIDLAVREILEFKKYGGNTIVELTSQDCGQDPIALKNISIASGLNIIMSTGFYTKDTRPDHLKEKNIDELAQILLKDIKQGVGSTGIKAGVIGEIGISAEISADEKRILNSSAIAQKETGVAIFIHPWIGTKNGLEIVDVLEKAGADLSKVVLCHMGRKMDLKYFKELLDRNIYIEFDLFGKNNWLIIDDKIHYVAPDFELVDAMQDLANINEDYIKKILVSTDVCIKMNLVEYGGFGYAHILKNILPIMKIKGFTEKQINYLISKNPIEVLSIRN